jgi:tetratricopeptide (TPR) repeat protein
MSERYTVVQLDEVDGYADEGRPRWHMIRSVLGIESFGVNAWRATEAGQAIIGEHDELGLGAGGHEELYVVLEGRATFTLDGETVPAPAGALVFVRDPAVRRSAVADEVGTTVLVVGAKPGSAFSISPWERSAEALRYWTTGEWERAIEVLETQRAEDPGNANVLYNLACAESRAGRRDEALDHLLAAVEREPQFLEHAQGDADLEAIRPDPRFPRPD